MQDIIDLAFQKQAEDIGRVRLNFEKLFGALKPKLETNKDYALIQKVRGELCIIEDQHKVFQKYIEEG